MGLIEYYSIFACSTALAVWYLWYLPILREALESGVNNSLTQYPKVGHIIYILISALIAPVLLYPLLSQNAGELFCRGLRQEIFRED